MSKSTKSTKRVLPYWMHVKHPKDLQTNEGQLIYDLLYKQFKYDFRRNEDLEKEVAYWKRQAKQEAERSTELWNEVQEYAAEEQRLNAVIHSIEDENDYYIDQIALLNREITGIRNTVRNLLNDERMYRNVRRRLSFTNVNDDE